MTKSTIQNRQSERQAERGFTLVELAIVMIIIGLLIGGILKGQELIENARISSTVAQTKAIEVGISTFRDKFASMPGDITNPTQRITGCVGLCANAGDGNGILRTNAGGNAVYDPGTAVVVSEAANAFAQLAAAGMIGGVGGGANAAVATPGVSNPSLPVGGAWKIGFNSDSDMTGSLATIVSGTYIVSSMSLNIASTDSTTYALTAVQSASIDRKLDDGLPLSGSVVAISPTGSSNSCNSQAVAANPANNVVAVDSNYNEGLGGKLCSLAIRVQ